MTSPTYQTTCPKCGAQLQPVALDPTTAPWLCAGCARGFWAAELTTSARSVYRPRHDDWTLSGARRPIEDSVQAEVESALGRGTSLREDQLSACSRASLEALGARRGLSYDFSSAIAEHLANSGAAS